MSVRKFGQTLRKLRIAKNRTSQDIAQLLGVTRLTLERWERGEQQPVCRDIILECVAKMEPSPRARWERRQS